jgi:hypothetical protein
MMGLWKRKVWSVLDIGLLKIGVLLLGAVIGALFSGIVMENLWMLIAIGLLALIKPTVSYFKD